MSGRVFKVPMQPRDPPVCIDRTALVIIDMQKDFLEPGGFGDALGNNVSKLHQCVEPCRKLLEHAHAMGMLIIYTREGHCPCMSDLHPFKNQQPGGDKKGAIGTPGPQGRIMIQGEPGHDIIQELYPKPGETVIDKPGKGSFYATDLEAILRAQNISTLLVCGVTTEVCVHTTIQEANNQGYFCICISDCCASYFDDFHDMALKMICARSKL